MLIKTIRKYLKIETCNLSGHFSSYSTWKYWIGYLQKCLIYTVAYNFYLAILLNACIANNENTKQL